MTNKQIELTPKEFEAMILALSLAEEVYHDWEDEDGHNDEQRADIASWNRIYKKLMK